jgi:hypothetical protein
MKKEAPEELDKVCGNCNSFFPAEPGGSSFAICLSDSDFEPYIDQLLNNDYDCCEKLIALKRFPIDRQACPDFDPIEDCDDETEFSSELTAKIRDLSTKGQLTPDSLRTALAIEPIENIDWSKAPIESYVQRFHAAATVRLQSAALNGLGALVSYGNRAAFDFLCDFFRKLPPAQTPADCHFRAEILRYLRGPLEYERKVARMLVEDLFRTPSNQSTRSWYSEVWKFFKGCPPEVAEEALLPILDSPKFSYRIKQRVKEIIGLTRSLDNVY